MIIWNSAHKCKHPDGLLVVHHAPDRSGQRLRSVRGPELQLELGPLVHALQHSHVSTAAHVLQEVNLQARATRDGTYFVLFCAVLFHRIIVEPRCFLSKYPHLSDGDQLSPILLMAS